MPYPVATKAFCDRVWDSLFSSINSCKSLTRAQRRVYEHLWRNVDVRTRIYERPVGAGALARRVGLSGDALTRAIAGLCAKGFAHRLAPLARRPLRLALNPLIIESAYEQAKRQFPDLLAS